VDLNLKRTGDVSLDANSYSAQLQAAAEDWTHGSYPRTVLIGLGGTGSKSLIELRRLILERYGDPRALEAVSFLSIDTDLASIRPPAESEKPHPLEAQLAFATDERLNLGGEEFKTLIGPNIVQNPHIRDWWDEAALPSDAFNPGQGAGQIRPLSRLLLFAKKGEFDSAFDVAYGKVTSQKVKSPRVNTAAKVRIVVIAGLAGGTGSGAFMDIGAMIQERLRTQGNYTLESYLVTPGIFQTVEKSYPKAAANGFAALRELNHYLAHPFTARWGRNEEPVEACGLFDRYVLMTGTNAAGQTVANPSDCYRAIAENLFLDFGAGPMSGWVQGVRSNREQYLRSAVTYSYKLPTAGGGHKDTHADEWRNAFSSFGISKLVFPSWRLLNRAKYQLAGKMVELLDPGRRASIDDLITRHRNQFMFDAGFLQGELTGSGRHWLIRNRLARQSGAGPDINTVYDHLRKYEEDLKAAAESMFTEKNTEAHAADIWQELAANWGEPESKGAGGDWPNRITQNRRALVKEVEEQLPRTIEEFRGRPAVGLSGCIAILRDILVILEKPHDQALYRRWFQEKKADWDKTRTRAEQQYRDRIKRAHRASKGLLPQQAPHEFAVEKAAESFLEHWKARVNLFLADEAVKAIDRIKMIVNNQLARLEALVERMAGLAAEYQVRADFYAEPHASLLVKEIEVPAGFDDLLSYYLGTQPEEREERLERLLDRGLRKMGLTTLDALESRLTSDGEGFRDNLSSQAFYALRGENGQTAAFGDAQDDAKDGFVERHSILKVLNDMDGAERRKLFKQLYDKGLPWVFQARDDALMSEQKPHGDSFLGFVAPANDSVSGEMLDWLEQNTVPPYRRPQAVRAHDPAEIIFYTEINAFAVYYPSEVSDLRQKYDSFVNNDSVITPLHLHQDWHTFQPPIPWKIAQLASLQRAWNLLIKAQMLGVVRSISMRRDDDVRYTWQHRRVTGPFEVKWIDLGPEGHVIRRLMAGDRRTSSHLISDDVRKVQERFLKRSGGSWAHLLALADYYYYCIFPVRSSELKGGLNVTVGSMQNLVCTELREEWRRQAVSAGADADRLDLELKELFDRLMKWTVPCYRDETHVVPSTSDIAKTHRADDWLLLDPIGVQVEELCAKGQLKSSYDHDGSLILEFPRLAIDWSFFEVDTQDELDQPEELAEITPTIVPGEATPPPDPNAKYYYGKGREQLGELVISEIIEHVVASPDLAHRVWRESFGAEWKLVEDVPEIVALLPKPKATPPPLPVGPPPLPDDG
jgi:hypothetical protein